MRRLIYMFGVFLLRQGMGLMIWAAGDDFDDEDDEDTNALVYDVKSGPHERWEADDISFVPEEYEYFIIVLLEREGASKLEEYKMWFEDEEGCNYMINHFKTSIDPVKVRI